MNENPIFGMNPAISQQEPVMINRTVLHEVINLIEQNKVNHEIEWNIQIIGEACCGKTCLLSSIYSNSIINTVYSTRILWYSVGKIETINELLLLIDTIGSDISRELNSGENAYHPDSIDDWIFYLKDSCHMKEWLICLDDVYDQLLVDILLSAGASVIQTSSSSLVSTLFPKSKLFTFHLHDFSHDEITEYLSLYQRNHPTSTLTSTFYKLFHDISASPLDISILMSLISKYFLNNQVNSIEETFDSFFLQLYEQRADIAALSQSLNAHTPSTNHFRNLEILTAESAPIIDQKDYLRNNILRRTSIFMSIQIAISSLPQHVQAKYILLVILPKNQPATLPFLSHLWQCSNEITYNTILHLLSVHLLAIHSPHSQDCLTEFFQGYSVNKDLSQYKVCLHSMHYEYLESLITHSTVWLNRVHLAVERCTEYLLRPSCLSSVTVENYNSIHCHPDDEILLDSFFFPPIKIYYNRLGQYWRRACDLNHICSSHSITPTLELNLFHQIQDFIDNLNLSNDISLITRYLRSCISLINDSDVHQVSDITSWYQLLINLMEQDIQSDHSDIALYCIYYSIYLIRSQSKNKSYLLQAKEYLLKSLEIYQNIYSYDHRAISLLFTRLSLLSFDLNYSRDAIRYLQNSLEMKSCLYGTKHPYLGRDFNRLACILSLQKDYINAIVYHIAAIQSFQSTLGDHHIETILAYGNLGITLISDGKINNGMNILHDVLYCLFHAGTSLCHPWIQYFSSYLETFNDTTSSGSTRTSTVTSGAGTLPMEKDDKFINLISIDKIKSLNTSMTISFLFTSLNYDHDRGETGSLSQSSPSSSFSASLSPPSPPISITVMDPNPAHKLDFYSKNSRQSLALSPKESIHSSHPPSHDLGPISDQNRLPYAALVLTE